MKKYEISYNDEYFKEIDAESLDEAVDIVVGASNNLDIPYNTAVAADYDASLASVSFITEDSTTCINIKKIDVNNEVYETNLMTE